MPRSDEYVARAFQSLRMGQTSQAEELLRRGLARGSDDAAVRLTLSTIARNRSDWATAAAALQPIPDTDPNAVTVRVAEGDAWLRLNQAARADDAWRRAEVISPADELPKRRRLYLAAVQLRRPLWERLLWDLYDKGKAQMPEMLQLMVVDQLVWQTPNLLDEIRGYCGADPMDAHSHRALATYLVRAGRLAEAERILAALERRQPGDAATWSARVQWALAGADPDWLATWLETAPSQARETADYFKAAGALALLQRRYADAVGAYRQALGRNVYDLELHYKLAQALRFAGQPPAAERHLQMAGKLTRVNGLCGALYVDGWNLEHVRDLIRLCQELLLVEEAIGWTRLALQREPGDESLQATHAKLQGLPATSRRHPPTWEKFP